MSLLDRLIAAAEGDLDAQLLQRALGLVPEERIGDIVDAIAEGDAGQVLRAGKALLDEGLSIEQGLDALSERFRALLAACVCGADHELLGMSSEEAVAAAERAKAFAPEQGQSLMRGWYEWLCSQHSLMRRTFCTRVVERPLRKKKGPPLNDRR